MKKQLQGEHGFILPVVLALILLVFILMMAFLNVSASQIKNSRFTNSIIAAQNASDAGAKIVLRRVIPKVRGFLNAGDNNLANFDDGGINGCELDLTRITVFNNIIAGVKCTYVPDNGSIKEHILIESSASINNSSAKSEVWVTLYKPVNSDIVFALDIIKLVDKANENPKKNIYSDQSDYTYTKWLTESPDPNSPDAEDPLKYDAWSPTGTGKNYILFEDKLISPEFTIAYNLQFRKTSGSGGVGIIYGASKDNTAQKFDGYCAKYNNAMGAFSVTKFSAAASSSSPTEYSLPNNGTVNTGPVASDSINSTTKSGVVKSTSTTQYMFQPNGSAKDSKGNIISNGTGVDSLGNNIGRCSMPKSELNTVMMNYYNSIRNDPNWKYTHDGHNVLPDGREIPTSFDVTNSEQNMTISIQTISEPITVHKSATVSYTETRLRQIVRIDGCEVLNFIDFSDVTPGIGTTTKNPKIDLGVTGIRTGLRVVSLDNSQGACKFHSTPGLENGHTNGENFYILWKKSNIY